MQGVQINTAYVLQLAYCTFHYTLYHNITVSEKWNKHILDNLRDIKFAFNQQFRQSEKCMI